VGCFFFPFAKRVLYVRLPLPLTHCESYLLVDLISSRHHPLGQHLNQWPQSRVRRVGADAVKNAFKNDGDPLMLSGSKVLEGVAKVIIIVIAVGQKNCTMTRG